MSVLNPVVLLWDGENRRIYLKSGVSDFYPIEDIYHEYRAARRLDTNDLRKYNALLRAEGNVPKGGGAFTPRYVVLINGTKIVPFDETLGLNQLGDIITDNPDVDPTLYDTSQLTVSKVIYIKPSEAEVIQLNSPAIEYGEFNEQVTIDVINGVAGTAYPIGTARVPVNNLHDAGIIATIRGFKRIFFIGNFTFTPGLHLQSVDLIGQGMQTSTFTFEYGSILPYCKAYNAKLTGQEIGLVGYADCHLIDYGSSGLFPSAANVIANRCLVEGTISLPANFSGTVTALDCWGRTAIDGRLPTFDMNGGDSSLQMRNYSGTVSLVNCSSTTNDVKIFLSSGGVVLTSSVTAGSIKLAGVGTFINESIPGRDLIIDSTAILSMESVSQAVWDEPVIEHVIEGSTGYQTLVDSYTNRIHLVQGGGSGTTYPWGTRASPVGNIEDALVLGNNLDINTIHIMGNIVIEEGIDISGFVFISDRSTGNILTINNAITNLTYFENLTVGGTFNGTVRFTTCVLLIVNNYSGGAKNCLLTNKITITGNGSNYLTDCDTYVKTVGFFVSVDQGNHPLNIIRCRGNYRIQNHLYTGLSLFDLVAGHILIEDTCLFGTIDIDGIVEVTNNSGGSLVINHALGLDSIGDSSAQAVVNAPIEMSFTLGNILRILLSALAGKTSGGETTIIRFRDVADTKDRIVGTVTPQGDRTAVTLDPD